MRWLGAVEELVARVSGFGALQRYLDDPEVEEVWINSPDRVFISRAGMHELTSTILTAAQVADLVERMLKSSGRRIDRSQPFVDAMLPEGHRLHVVLEGISHGFSAVNIREHAWSPCPPRGAGWPGAINFVKILARWRATALGGLIAEEWRGGVWPFELPAHCLRATHEANGMTSGRVGHGASGDSPVL